MEREPQQSRRLHDELALLQAMYFSPDRVVWSEARREILFEYHGRTDADDDVDDGAGTTVAKLLLRVSDGYLCDSFDSSDQNNNDEDDEEDVITVLNAVDAEKRDLRDTLVTRLRDLGICGMTRGKTAQGGKRTEKQDEGVEVLDQILACFVDVVDSSSSSTVQVERPDQQTLDRTAAIQNTSTQIESHDDHREGTSTTTPYDSRGETKVKTVVIWLHHLLATGKRKLALNPSISTLSTRSDSSLSSAISGITKPGYPGVMLFSGPSSLVDAHVSELKAQRWQAFQVRFEEEYVVNHDDDDDDSNQPKLAKQIQKQKQSGIGKGGKEQDATVSGVWTFEHGRGIVEVDSMSEVVQKIQSTQNREVFLKVIGVK